MKTILLLLSVLLLPQAQVAPKPSKGKGGKIGTLAAETIKVGGQTRDFKLVAPKGADGEAAVPLVFVFHGLGDSKEGVSRYSGFEALAAKKGFIAVFPDALNKRWNIKPADDNEDVKYFDALYDHVTSKYNVDLRRVYFSGMSMGGYFSNCLASQRSEKVAAIAPHSGGLGVLAFTGVKAKRKYPAMVVHGDADNVVKVEEGRKSKEVYTKEGHKVEYVELAGLGHTWAFKENITDKMWKFFLDHPLP
ncbi:MAG TPA: PHB depolymerase family esterase [Planctomycetota bacterium]|nr:PHB depolymerase family esterase [Planctomycetota bacterium]